MDPLRDMLATDQRQALNFFFVGLKDIATPNADRQELLYNASVLAHYTQVSSQAEESQAAPGSLSAIFDRFVADTSLLHDSHMMETAGAQCLLLAGFFEDQMQRRHNIPWYAKLGAGFFSRAATCEESPKRSHLLDTMAAHFEYWRRVQARLSRELRDQPYLISTRPS